MNKERHEQRVAKEQAMVEKSNRDAAFYEEMEMRRIESLEKEERKRTERKQKAEYNRKLLEEQRDVRRSLAKVM